MAKTLLRNNTQSPITLPAPYTGIIAPGDAVVLDDPPSVVSEVLGVVPWLINYLTVSQVPDSQPVDGHDRNAAAAGIVGALASLTEPLDLNGQRIVNVADPAAPQDAATQQYVIDYVATHGGGGGGGAGVTSVTAGTGLAGTPNPIISTGTLAVDFGSAAGKVTEGNDVRLNPTPSTAGGVVYDTGVAYSATAAGSVGQVLKVGAGGLPEWGADNTSPTGAAGGSLAGTYPNPTIAAGAITDAEVSAIAAIATSKLSGALTDISGNGLAAFLNAGTKLARTYYVAVNGNDTTGDGSISAPFATVQKAHDVAATDYPSGEFVAIEIGSGIFSGDINITRKNTLIQGAGHRAEMLATKLVGSITVNPIGATSQYADLVGVAGCWVAPSSATTAPAIKATGSTLYGLILNDCYLYTTNATATASALACDATHASRPRIIANDCIIRTESAGPAIMQLDRGDVRCNNTQIGHNSGVTLGAAGNGVNVLNNATLWLNNSLVETRTRDSAVLATGASAGVKLLVTVGSVATAYAGAEDTTHGITVSNSAGVAAFLWQASFNVADVSAAVYAINGSAPAVVVYGELSFQPGTNSGIASAVTLTPMVEKHATMNLPSLTASLPLKLDANKNVTAAALSLSGSEVTGTLAVGKGGTGIATTPPAGAVTYGNGSTQAYTAVGASGQPLISAGTGAPAFGALNLAGGVTIVTGTLPAANQAAQSMGGDVSGTTDASTVIKLQANPVQSGALAAGDAGKALVWSGSEWAPTTLTPGGGGGGGGGGLTYYLNFNTAGAAPLPNAGDKQLALTYDTTAQNTGAIVAPHGTYATLAEFVTDLNLPGATTIPPGNWDIAAYLNLATGANNTFFRARVYKWDGTTLTELATSPSDDVALAQTAFPTLYTASVYISQAVLTASDRLVIRLEVTRSTAAVREVVGYFGGNTPSHVHSTLGAPGGTGLVKVVDGIVQAPATLLVNADVSLTADIAVSKLAKGTASTVLHGGGGSDNYFGKIQLGTEVEGQLPVGNGGTGLASGTAGGLPYFNASNTMASSGALTQYALMVGGGTSGPATLSSLGTTSQVLKGNASGVPSWGAISLGTDVSGSLAIANGGTNGSATPTAGAVAYGTGSAYDFTSAGTAGQVLTSGGIGAPAWVTTLGYAAGGTGTSNAPTNHGVAYGDGTKLVYTAAGTPGQVLQVGVGGDPEWGTNTAVPTGLAGGDLSGNYPNPTVAKINAATVPAAGALVTGNVLQVSGTSALTYGAVNLQGGAGFVTGILPIANGGTGINSTPSGGEIVYGATTGKYALSAAGTSGQYLKSNGTGAPTWSAIDISTASVTGTLPIARGGTGNTVAPTQWGVIYAGSTTAYASTGAGVTGQILQATTGGAPVWGQTIGSSGTDVNTAGRDVVASAQVTPAALTTIPVSVSTIRLSGNAGPVDYTGTFPTLAVSGIADGTRITLINESAYAITLGDDTTYSGTKIQLGGPATRVLQQYTAISFTYDSTIGFWVESGVGGSGVVQSVTAAAANNLITVGGTTANPTIALSGLGSNPGSAGGLPYFSSASALGAVAAGTSGQVLKSNGSSAPSWISIPYDVAGLVPGIPSAGATVFYFKATRAFTLSATSADHVFAASIASTGTAVFTVYRNASQILTATFNASNTATISAVTNNTISVGDVITVVAPSPADSTLLDVYWTLSGTL